MSNMKGLSRAPQEGAPRRAVLFHANEELTSTSTSTRSGSPPLRSSSRSICEFARQALADFLDIAERTKDIRYLSRTRAITDPLADGQKHAMASQGRGQTRAGSVAKTAPILSHRRSAAEGTSINVVHLIKTNKPYEGNSNDYEFSTDTMCEHWQTGLDDGRNPLAHRDWFDTSSRERGFITHDADREKGKQRGKGGRVSRRADPPVIHAPVV
ncbi:DUF3734 domain-containing protein [Paraburkholderia strydomiana]|uniref:DUF3734 domain-containing protein n=1 Tax=Paraburkholderia strydomiana TaxID=1245417 RepID=UPI0028628153|nr:DUF3734 domain-containing protein [Paraburkholderia strydomiana]MDR7009982.1 hypothetical protein [Paraburkholderia strydomiana]